MGPLLTTMAIFLANHLASTDNLTRTETEHMQTNRTHKVALINNTLKKLILRQRG